MSPRIQSLPRPKLDRAVMVDTALAVADAEGIEAVTIRRLAQELSVTPMALYWHVKDKDALLAAIADRMWDEALAELDRSMAARAGWADGRAVGDWDQLRCTLDALLTAMRRHPAVAAFAPSRVVECESGLIVTERTLAFLAERGFDPAQAAEIARFVLCSAVMLVDSQPGADIAEATERAEAQRLKRIGLASLPAGRYPHIAASAEFLTDCGAPDAYFDRGVDLVVSGVRSQAASVPNAHEVSAPPS